jgi:hypothetical protein
MGDLEDFNQEVECIYKNEHYSARDNGAVYRHPLAGKRVRPTDNKWTFGKLNDKTGYPEIASVSVHRIVASAFHGEPPTKEHVVDHIDTNKQNNRPDNLRWVTRLENIILNPITARRIELVCGSVEAFLADDLFHKKNPSLVPIFKKAKEMINGDHKDYAVAYIIFDRHWSTMTEANKKAIWNWCKVIVILAQRAANL